MRVYVTYLQVRILKRCITTIALSTTLWQPVDSPDVLVHQGGVRLRLVPRHQELALAHLETNTTGAEEKLHLEDGRGQIWGARPPLDTGKTAAREPIILEEPLPPIVALLLHECRPVAVRELEPLAHLVASCCHHPSARTR